MTVTHSISGGCAANSWNNWADRHFQILVNHDAFPFVMSLSIHAALAIQENTVMNSWSLSTPMVVFDMPTTRIIGMTA